MELGLASESTLLMVEQLRTALLNKDSIRELEHFAKTTRKKKVFSETGNELDIDRVMCGDPQHWQKTTPGKQTKIVKIGVNLVMSRGFGSATMNQIASFGVVACELLMQAGLNVEMSALYLSGGITREIVFGGEVVICKHADEILDINKLCVTGIPGILRFFDFATIDCILDGSADYGFGRSMSLPDELKEHLNLDLIIDSKTTQQEIEINLYELLKFETHES
jgi:hypothetical protein